MITQELLTYIENQIKEGKSTSQIIQTLLQAGWKQEDIDEGFNRQIKAPEVKKNILLAKLPFKKLLLTGFTIFALILIYFLVFNIHTS